MFEAHDIARYREQTERRAKTMAGVAGPSFHCRGCGEKKTIKGRKPLVPGYTKAGYRCAECVAKKEAA